MRRVDLIAFDPARDITVQPWLEEKLDRPFRKGDVIVGARREERVGAELLVFGEPLTVYGRLGKTAVGTHENGIFMSFETLAGLRETMLRICGAKAPLEPNKLSGVLIELAPGATVQQVRFAVLANFPDLKVVAGGSTLTSIRQGLVSLAGRGSRPDGGHVRQHRGHGQRPFLGDHHRAAPRARAAEGDRRAPRPDHRHAADRGRDGHGRGRD